MKSKFLKSLITLFVLTLSAVANSSVITVSNWHDTSDAFQGLKKSNFSDDIFYAVSLNGIFNNTSTYEIMAGYRWATETDYLAAWANRDLINGDFLNDSSYWVYYNQGGWSSYRWNNVDRYEFLFADSLTTGRSTHAGTVEGMVSSWATRYLPIYTPTDPVVNNWAGLVLIKDDSQAGSQASDPSANEVPEPSILATFVLALIGVSLRKVKTKLR